MAKLIFVGITAMALAPALAFADPGYDVAKRADQDNRGYKGQRAQAKWALFGPDGKLTVTYETLQITREADAKEGPRSLIRFLSPPDTKGTALLTHEHLTGEDDRWLYLSETRQVKRISGSNKSASFKGSELSYEDLVFSVLDRYSWKLLGEKTVDGRAVNEVERLPKFEDSGYKRSLGYFDKENGYLVESRFFDKGDQPLKVAKFKDHKQYNGKWRPHTIDVANIQTKRRTTITFEKYELGLDLPETLFTQAQLSK